MEVRSAVKLLLVIGLALGAVMMFSSTEKAKETAHVVKETAKSKVNPKASEAEHQAWLNALRANMDKWKADADEMGNKMNKMSAVGKEKYFETMANLRHKATDLNEYLNSRKSKTAEAWEDFREHADNSWEELKKGLADVGDYVRGNN